MSCENEEKYYEDLVRSAIEHPPERMTWKAISMIREQETKQEDNIQEN